MDFELTEEQSLLRDTVRSVFKSYDIEKIRAVSETDTGWSASIWESLAEIGILGLPFSEDAGGFGASSIEVESANLRNTDVSVEANKGLPAAVATTNSV